MLTLGTIELGEKPAVVIAIQRPVSPADLAMECPHAIVELRLDGLADTSPAAHVAFAEQYEGFNRLATIRHQDEGGAWRGNEEQRLASYRAVLPVVDAVDVEVLVGSITNAVVAAAHDSGKIVIGSFHDFDETPSAKRLEEVFAAGRAAGVDIVKVAARCNTAEDGRRLAAFTLAHCDDNIIVVGMGPYGMASRIFFPALGSLLTYTFLGEPTAPGQLNCHDTLKYLNGFYPQGVARP
tara:strand:+ start:282 stop:995 length:714 start_codon:yes stop_codon:yes gene_type:complete